MEHLILEGYMELNRKPNDKEFKLIELLIEKSGMIFSEHSKEELMVCNIDDGKMGSLKLFPARKTQEKRVFGEQISEFQFQDLDGVNVIASLNIDSHGDLFELDIWKTDFSSLLEFPNV